MLAAARELAPDAPSLLELAGELELALGHPERAAETWSGVLGEGSSRNGLAERVAALTGREDPLEQRFATTLDEARELLATIEPAGGGDPAAVIARQTDAIHVKANGLSSRFHQKILEVRHPEAANFARQFSVTYSPKLQRATIIDARLIRKDGSVILAARRERALMPDAELRMWYDTRVIRMTFPRLEEGDLIDVRYRVEGIGASNPIRDGYFGDVLLVGQSVPVLSTEIAVLAPSGLPVRHKIVHYDGEPTVSAAEEDGELLTRITLPPLPAFEDAPLAPPLLERAPYLVLGTTSSWTELAEIYADLIDPQLRITPDIRETVRELTSRTRSRRDKVDALYAWVIENTRYVALEFGIHAIKPYAVGAVFHKRLGDCKDKASLLVAMLAEAGIEADIALVRSQQRGDFDAEIPVFAAFDHAIVHVPSEKLWLDATTVHHAADELPMGDRDALALLVRGGSGTLSRTPEATPDDAQINLQEEIKLTPQGSADVAVEVQARGETAALERHYFRLEERPSVILENRLRRRGGDVRIKRASFDAVDLDDEVVRYHYSGRVERFARRVDGGVSAPLALALPPLLEELPAQERRVPLELPQPFRWTVESSFVIPENANVTESPQPRVLESPWGRVEIEVRRARDVLRVKTVTELASGSIPVDEIERFSAFLADARQALGQRIILEWSR